MKRVIMFALACLITVSCFASCSGTSNTSPAESSKAITAYSFSNPSAFGMVNENIKTVSITVPYGTNITNLAATFTTTGTSVKVGSVVQVSGTTTNDFSSPVVYTVTAADGSTAQYTVTVTVALSSSKTLESFSILSIPGTINEADKTVALSVPYGTNVTALIATFTTTGASVKVSSNVQISGTTTNDFTNPVVYTVTAADGSTVIYTVSVTIAPSDINTEIFVANSWADSITVYNTTDSGNLTPVRTISGSSTGLAHPSGVAVDRAKNEIIVANIYDHSVSAYNRTDSGDITPLRTISGANTLLNAPNHITLDTVNNEVFVANYGSITVYTSTDNGNVAPLRIITGSSTGLDDTMDIAVDTVNSLIIAANYGDSIMVYNRTDIGNVAPISTISGTNTGLSVPTGIVLDTVNDEIFVSNAGTNSITVYRRIDSGNVSPVRIISGTNTGLMNPSGIAVDTVNNLIFVINAWNIVTVYNRTANGNVAPLRSISGSNTGLNYPSAIALW